MEVECIELPSRIPIRPLKYLSKLRSIKRIIREFAPDILNAHFVPNYGFLGVLSGFRPLVVTTWGSDVLVSAWKSPLHTWRARFVLKNADLITSDGDNLSQGILRLGGSKEKLLTINMGVDMAVFSPVDKKPQPPLIVSTRQLLPIYDVATFVEAAATVHMEFPDVRFAVAGGGDEREMLERIARERGLSTMEFLGVLDEADVASLLQEATVYVSTSLSDSTSVSLLEAMACGAIPVMSDIEGNRSWITEEENGFLFPPGAADVLAKKLKHVLTNPETVQKIVPDNIRLMEETASWAAVMGVVEDRFKELVSR
jgi:glycosyltransferase involved in cell wall biosynthesis